MKFEHKNPAKKKSKRELITENREELCFLKMSYKDLLYDGQLWALEQMTKEKAEDPPDLAERRLSLVILKSYILSWIIIRSTDFGVGGIV